ncbi:hypothetical protein SEA_SATIS_284 [Streptomyces phage Satis]|nr:hypothetical protein SEA_SATIS_284 [Streptomyces phage Satis]QBZ72170.1 hypothetical protein SEA_KRADAL_284 [Streptomyces phage Kradal]QPL14592.1 hypothetical protein SEA_EHYELIMAYOE_287 [Streptomyces phage EhyElimayoE]
MKASEFPDFLRELKIEGAVVGPVLNDKGEPAGPGSGLQYGFLVTSQHGARIAFQVATQEDGMTAGDGPPAPYPQAVPVQPDRLVCRDVETSIAAWIGQSSAGRHVRAMKQYSDEPGRKGIRFGLVLDLYSGGRVFIQALWILEPGEAYTKDNKFRMRDEV